MATQSIIVYRNPGEEAIWNLLMTGEFFVTFASFIVGFVVFILAEEKIPFSIRRKMPLLTTMLSLVGATITFKWLWI